MSGQVFVSERNLREGFMHILCMNHRMLGDCSVEDFMDHIRQFTVTISEHEAEIIRQMHSYINEY